jgi:mycothiol synthase
VLRELREEDAEGVAALFEAAFGAARRLDAEEVRSWLRNTELQPELLRVLERDGRVVGYGDLWFEGGDVALDVAAPGEWAAFFDWAEREGRARGSSRVRVYVPADHELARVAASRGYHAWRSSYTMEVELGEDAPESSEVPRELALAPYREGDAEAVRHTLNESFAEDPFHHETSPANFREFFLGARGFDPALWLLAWDGDELAGFSLAFAERVGEPGLGWVGTLGVRPRWRRRGLGEALLRASLRSLHERGLRRVGLGVDTENVTGALRLYERVGMRPVRRYDNWVRDL